MKKIRSLCIIIGLFVVITILHSQDIQPPLNVNEVVTQLRDFRYNTTLQEGGFPLDTNFVYERALGAQAWSAVAFDGSNYLVVWEDTRADSRYDIFGARVSPLGVVLDSASIVISAACEYQAFPAVAFDGINYLVVWDDSRDSLVRDIYGTRVTPSGVVLDPDGIVISNAYDRQCDPAVAFDGTNYLVVWTDFRNNPFQTDLYGARITPSGTVLDPAGIAISTAGGHQTGGAIAFDGANYLVVWGDYRNSSCDVYGARVTPTGSVLDSLGIPIASSSSFEGPDAVAFDGVNYLITWLKNMNSYDIYASRITTSGTVIDTSGILVYSTGDAMKPYNSVAFDGANYLIVWSDLLVSGYLRIYGARVTPQGIVLDTAGIVISPEVGDQFRPQVAFDNTNYLVVWGDMPRWDNIDIFGTRVSPSGMVLDTTGILLSPSAHYQHTSSITFDGINYFVVWDEFCGMEFNIYGVRINELGIVLDPVSIVISTEDSSQRAPEVAIDSANYFVTWHDKRNSQYNEIYGARVTQSGSVVDTAGINITQEASDQVYPSVVFDGINYFVAWTDYRNSSTSEADIYGARISQSGIVLDPLGLAVSSAPSSQRYPSIAFDGSNYFAVWQDKRSGSWDIYGARVTQSGSVVDTAGINITQEAYDQVYPSVTFDGTNYFIVWEDWRNNATENPDIYGARVSQNGVVLDTTGIAISMSMAYSYEIPSIAFDGTNYVVIWQGKSSGMFYDLHGAKINPSGVVIDSFMMCTQMGNQLRPAITRGTTDQLLVTYSGWTDSVNGKLVNTKRIWGKYYPLVGIDEESDWRNIRTQIGLHIYPNPINNQCNINYALNQKSKVSISLYDVTGRLVKNMVDESKNPGNHNNVFDITNLPQGVYFIRLSIESHSITKKVVFIK